MIRPPRRRTSALLAATTAAVLTVTGLTASAAQAEVVEHVVNGTFDSDTAPWWWTDNLAPAVASGQLCAAVPGGTTNPWDAILGQDNIPLVNGRAYTLSFTASASAAVTVRANVQIGVDPFTAPLSRDVVLGPAGETFSFTFTSTLDNPAGQVAFQVGRAADAWDLCLDDISLTSDSDSDPQPGPAEQVENGTFDNGTAGWFSYGGPPATVLDGRFCGTIPGGLANPFDAGMGQNDVTLIAGESYQYSFEVSGSPAGTIRTAVQLQDPPFTADLSVPLALTPEPQTFTFAFTAAAGTERAQVVFHVGGNPEPITVCVDNVSLLGGVEEPPYVPDTGPRVRVNQVGYLPFGPKNATVVTEAPGALPWQLHNAAGETVASGTTEPRGTDPASGQHTHTVDFSAVTATGTGFTLVADGETSYPFDISGDIYTNLRSDALQFFYIQRSGTAIDGALVGEQYARPAGHLGVAPNQGDTDVPCQPGGCDYRLDVRGGWYDAGDHGKYVVNGGIATYQLLSAYERTKTAPTARPGALEDSTLRLPERGNGVPDVLDEARWELEFLLRMQVPAGQPLAGMAHHKIHDENWTGLPLQPEDDPQPRQLHRPSTAATLNLAATAAQCGRLYARYDPAFADRCLTAARRAWTAAVANPDLLADPNDGNGGGAYSDTDVSDEFYWAAVELYLTTGEQQYLAALRASPHHTGDVFSPTGFNWPALAAVGRLELATVPNGLPAAERDRIRASVLAGADAYLATLRAEAYGLPLPGTGDTYFWGSNSNIINNVIVLATAFDLSGDLAYRDGALQGMDYIFGRNALNHSYVTGYGEKNPQNQHSRIFAHQIDPALPNPPAGSLAGGANANLEDPFASGLLSGCRPQFCYVDHIDSFSTNEVAINWNSALSWIASFLADQGTGQPAAPSTCDVSYLSLRLTPGFFLAQVVVRNTGTAPVIGWTVRWAFTGDQGIRQSWLAHVAQSGPWVTARNQGLNRRIDPGGTVTFGFIATTSLANPTPGLFTVNGAACT